MPLVPVRRRRVFYIPGYDPIHPRRYRELYRSESAAQAQISGYQIDLSARPARGETYGWDVTAQVGGQDTQTAVDVLVWSDIVRDSMSNSIPATYWQLLRTAWVYIATGTLRRLMWMRKGPVLAALYPVGMLLAQLLLAVGLAGAASGVISMVAPLVVMPFTQLAGVVGLGPEGIRTVAAVANGVLVALSWMVWIAGTVLILRWFKSKDGRLYAYYLMHDYAYSARYNGANPQPLEQRMARFADQIAAALTEDLDEVLVVGHSSGAHLAVSIIADLLRADQVPGKGPELALLSLGQVVPMVSFLPEAYRLRSDLAYMAVQKRVTWVDVTAPGDGCCFALCDPVAVSGVAPDTGQHWPLILSAAFTQTLSPARWKALRWRFFRLHFQYLCAFDRPGDYDYFQITAGPVLLSDRYRDRSSSKSRIDVPASRYTALAP